MTRQSFTFHTKGFFVCPCVLAQERTSVIMARNQISKFDLPWSYRCFIYFQFSWEKIATERMCSEDATISYWKHFHFFSDKIQLFFVSSQNLIADEIKKVARAVTLACSDQIFLSSIEVITNIIKKITISSIVIGLEDSYFSTDSLAKLLLDSLLLETLLLDSLLSDSSIGQSHSKL